MARRIILTLAITLSLAVIGLLGWQNIPHRDARTSATDGSSVSLARPAFAQTASFLDQEAGIAAYVQVPSLVDLEGVKGAFKIIEQETSDFVVGTVEIPNAPLAPHAFVGSDGWVVAYFLRDESLGKAWPYAHGFKPPDDVLARALTQVSSIVGGAPTSISYFGFEHPGANRVSVINAPSIYDYFEVQIPNGFQVFEAAETRVYSDVSDVTSSIQIGQFQEWRSALIVVYNVQSNVRILVRNADSLWQSPLGRPDFKSGSGATPTPMPTATPPASPTPSELPTATPPPTTTPPPTLTLIGDASQTGSHLRLTDNSYSQSSAAWFTEKQSVVDGFTMSFDWRFTRDDPGVGADGFAFVIQNTNGIALGHHGYGIGYSGIVNSLAVEFDTYRNVASEFEGPEDDPNDNHLSVQSRGGWWQNKSDPQFSLAHTTDIPFLSDGEWHEAQIVYEPGTLTVSLDGEEVFTVAVNIEDYVILDETGTAWVGFTAATGDWPQSHNLRNISFTPAS